MANTNAILPNSLFSSVSQGGCIIPVCSTDKAYYKWLVALWSEKRDAQSVIQGS
jgi:hypothetical protein